MVQEGVVAFVHRFADDSPDLLRYVGLADPKKLYRGIAAQAPLPLNYGAN
jgi:hypothetical protein